MGGRPGYNRTTPPSASSQPQPRPTPETPEPEDTPTHPPEDPAEIQPSQPMPPRALDVPLPLMTPPERREWERMQRDRPPPGTPPTVRPPTPVSGVLAEILKRDAEEPDPAQPPPRSFGNHPDGTPRLIPHPLRATMKYHDRLCLRIYEDWLHNVNPKLAAEVQTIHQRQPKLLTLFFRELDTLYLMAKESPSWNRSDRRITQP